MLKIIKSMGELDFDQLLRVYCDDLLEHCEQERFYDYLLDFFRESNASYYIWIEDGMYVSALRIEPYRDGRIVAGLQTAPDHRRRGYAKRLLTEVCSSLQKTGCLPVYSHVEKRNRASLHTHWACGFTEILDYAVFLDGSVSRNSCTLQFP